LNSALIVSNTDEIIDLTTKILKKISCNNIYNLKTATKTRQSMLEHDFELCIIDSPLKDEQSQDLAIDISANYICGVIVLVQADQHEEISYKLEDYGIIVLPKPVQEIFLWNAIKLNKAIYNKILLVQNENNKLIKKIEDIRIINRAKCLLISQHSMSEPEAHKFIEKQAMNRRVSRRRVSEGILNTYEH
jgi:two-component system, response regulator PdtaR